MCLSNDQICSCTIIHLMELCEITYQIYPCASQSVNLRDMLELHQCAYNTPIRVYEEHRVDQSYQAFFYCVKTSKKSGFSRSKSPQSHLGWGYNAYSAGWRLHADVKTKATEKQHKHERWYLSTIDEYKPIRMGSTEVMGMVGEPKTATTVCFKESDTLLVTNHCFLNKPQLHKINVLKQSVATKPISAEKIFCTKPRLNKLNNMG